MQKKERVEILLEDLVSKVDGIAEVLAPMPPRLVKIEQQLETIEGNVKVIKGVLRENSADIVELKAKAHSH